jgi:hypothetical protein
MRTHTPKSHWRTRASGPRRFVVVVYLGARLAVNIKSLSLTPDPWGGDEGVRNYDEANSGGAESIVTEFSSHYRVGILTRWVHEIIIP